MTKLFLLIKGDFVRLVKYKALIFSLLVTAVWIVVIALVNSAEALVIAPLLILSDLCMMSVLLLAAMYYYEKQEGTLITTLISPVKTSYLVLSKFATQAVIGLVSVLLISLSVTIFHPVKINYPLILLYSVIITVCSCALGYILVFASKDFTSMIVNFAFFMLILFIPTILYTLNILPQSFRYILMLSPLHSAQVLITSAITHQAQLWEVLTGALYLCALSAVIIILVIAKKFKGYAMRG